MAWTKSQDVYIFAFQVDNFAKVHADFGNRLQMKLNEYKNVSFTKQKWTNTQHRSANYKFLLL